MPNALAPAALRQLMVTILGGATGKPEAHWNSSLGDLTPLPFSLSPATNWRVSLKRRMPADEHAVDHAVKLLRAKHPYVAW